jgi:hypothetical protein
MAERKRLYEQLHPEASYDARPGRAGKCRQDGDNSAPAERLTASTAKASGRSERDVQRDAERAKKIGDHLPKVVGTSLDKGVELDALARLPDPDRKPLIDRAVAGEQVSALPPPTIRFDRFLDL